MRPRSLLVLGWLALIPALVPAGDVEAQNETCVFDGLVCPGDILVTDPLSDAILRVHREPQFSGPQEEIIASVPGTARGIAVDANGFPFVSESVSDSLYRVNLETGFLDVVYAGSPFVMPEDVVIEPSGNLLVVEPFVYAVLRFDPVVGDLEYAAFSALPPDGEFLFPEGIALDPDDEATLYVADGNTNRPAIWRVDLDTYEIELVTKDGLLQAPHDVAVIKFPGNEKQLLVSDPLAQTVFRVDPLEPFVENSPEDNQHPVAQAPDLVDPLGLFALDDEGAFLVVDFEQSTILKFGVTSGQTGPAGPTDSYGGGLLDGPSSVTVVGDVQPAVRSGFVVADTDAQTLYRVAPISATEASREVVPTAHALAVPTGVAVDGSDDSILVCEAEDYHAALLRVEPDETVAERQYLVTPNRVVVHDLGPPLSPVYFVADPAAGVVLQVQPNGLQSYLPVPDENYIVEPVALAVDRDGILIVLNHDVESSDPVFLVRVNPETGYQNPLSIPDNLLIDPVDLALDANGDILVADRGGEAPTGEELAPLVLRFDPVTGDAKIKSYGSALFGALEGIAVDLNRDVLLSHAGNADAVPVIEPGLIRVDPTSGSASVVEIPGETWTRPNGIALDIGAQPSGVFDDDGDAVGDSFDVCPGVPNPQQEDADGDGYGDDCDNCPTIFNPSQANTVQPSDGVGDACDDLDGDGVPTPFDNCPTVANPGDPQPDSNGNGVGDACEDLDEDGLDVDDDNCPDVPNAGQEDEDLDGVGDACDNCPDNPNGPAEESIPGVGNQTDTDDDGYGDACEDLDGDGVGLPEDTCPELVSEDLTDSDLDGLGDVCDNCPTIFNPGQENTYEPSDGIGDACDDLDGDGVRIPDDNCPDVPNPGTPQPDADTDGVGDACDNCPGMANGTGEADILHIGNQTDANGDGIGDACQPDDQDHDGWPDVEDNCPEIANGPWEAKEAGVGNQTDANGDGIGDACQADDQDDDGWPDVDDNCWEVANPNQLDTNSDGIGNRCDPDYDDDGTVGLLDFVILSQSWGARLGQPDYDPDYDSDDDDEQRGEIGLQEFILISQQWGRVYSLDPPGLLQCNGITIPCPAP